nr:hypothetical protein [Halomonas urmiana]
MPSDPALYHKRLLVVDDHAVNVELLQDLLLLDIRMPHLDGYAVLEALQEAFGVEAPPTIVPPGGEGHRDHRDDRPGSGLAAAPAAGRSGGQYRDRRFRHRPLVARLPAADAGRHHQDRPQFPAPPLLEDAESHVWGWRSRGEAGDLADAATVA